jgi:hypothetical protein
MISVDAKGTLSCPLQIHIPAKQIRRRVTILYAEWK